MAATLSRALAACGLVYGFIACSSDEGAESGTPDASGGAFGTGGLAATGGGAPTGGVTSTGGFGPNGGTPSTGGVPSGGMPPAGGTSGAGGGPAGTGGAGTGGGMATGGSAPSGTGGAPATGTGGASGDSLEALRASCVATINQYRATLTEANLKPLVRPAASVEACSDQGAQSDASTGGAHGSAGKCAGTGSQNTCPGYPPNRTTGVEGAMKQCLAQMWAEGEPPVGKAECLRQYFAGDTACFLAHGHYLNMSDPASGFVSCGFYTMPNGRIWMNQDFGR